MWSDWTGFNTTNSSINNCCISFLQILFSAKVWRKIHWNVHYWRDKTLFKPKLIFDIMLFVWLGECQMLSKESRSWKIISKSFVPSLLFGNTLDLFVLTTLPFALLGWCRDNKDDTRGSKHNVKLPAIHKPSTNKHRASQRREEQPAVPARQTRVRLPKMWVYSLHFDNSAVEATSINGHLYYRVTANAFSIFVQIILNCNLY